MATLGRELFAAGWDGGRLVHNLNGHLLLLKLSDAPLPAGPYRLIRGTAWVVGPGDVIRSGRRDAQSG